jgi:hypothetical protein
MRSEFLDLELIWDFQTVAAVCAELISIGRILICHGCGDAEALIAAFLVFEQAEEAWPLCGSCLSELPMQGAVV